VISGFRCDVDEICALQGYYTAQSGYSVPKFRDTLSVPLKMGPKSRPHHTLRNIPEARRFQQPALISFQDSSLANETNMSVVYKTGNVLMHDYFQRFKFLGIVCL
jgi:hypothetical protein